MITFSENEHITYNFNLKKNINKIDGFDLDHTIISPKHGIFPVNESDWKYSFSEIKNNLINLNQDYNIVIFTNQKSFNSKSELICNRINNFINDLGFIPSIII